MKNSNHTLSFFFLMLIFPLQTATLALSITNIEPYPPIEARELLLTGDSIALMAFLVWVAYACFFSSMKNNKKM